MCGQRKAQPLLSQVQAAQPWQVRAYCDKVTGMGAGSPVQSIRCTRWNAISYVWFPSQILTEQHLWESLLTSLCLSPHVWNVHPNISHIEFCWLLTLSWAQWLAMQFIELFPWLFFMPTSRTHTQQSSHSKTFPWPGTTTIIIQLLFLEHLLWAWLVTIHYVEGTVMILISQTPKLRLLKNK